MFEIQSIADELYRYTSKGRSPKRIDKLKEELRAIADAEIAADISNSDPDARDYAIRALWLACADWTGLSVPITSPFFMSDNISRTLTESAHGATVDEYRARLEAAIDIVHGEIRRQYDAFRPTVDMEGVAAALSVLAVGDIEERYRGIEGIAELESLGGFGKTSWLCALARGGDADIRFYLAGVLLDGLSGRDTKHQALAVLAALDAAALDCVKRRFVLYDDFRESRYIYRRFVSDRKKLRAYFRAAFKLLAKTVKDDAAVRFPYDVYTRSDFSRIDRAALEALAPQGTIESILSEVIPAPYAYGVGRYAYRLRKCGMTDDAVRVWLEDARETLAAFTDDDGNPLHDVWDSVMPVPEDD